VFTHDVALEGFTHAQWVLLGRAFTPLGERSPDAPAPAGGVVAVTSGNVLRKLVSTRRGRLDVREQPWPEALEHLAAQHGARWAIELPTGALEELVDRFGERLRPGQDYLGQALEFLSIVRELETERALSVWPWRISEWPVPSERAVQRAFDLLCPDGKAMVFGVFDKGELATSVALRRRGSGIDKIVGPDEIRHEMGLLSGDFRRDHRHLVSAVERSVAPVAVGCFGELATFRALAGTREAGAWARAVAAQDVVISPWMPALAVPLGVDVGRAALREVRALASWLGASHFISRDGPVAQVLLGMERPPWLQQDLSDYLGFDPFRLVGRLLSRELDSHVDETAPRP
jgi:hypothetical protein